MISFTLTHDSIIGFKTAWNSFTIPDNKAWPTARSRIEDPQFVNCRDYNFTLNFKENTPQPPLLQASKSGKIQDDRNPR